MTKIPCLAGVPITFSPTFLMNACPTGLLDIFIYFIFDIILCFGGISLRRTLYDAYYEEDESH